MKKLTMDELNRISVGQYKQSEKTPLCVVLDNVRSMNNIGSVFRTADAFRIEKIYLCGITATPPHRDIHKTALGAEDSVDWEYVETPSTVCNGFMMRDMPFFRWNRWKAALCFRISPYKKTVRPL